MAGCVVPDRQNALKRIEKLIHVETPETFEIPASIASDIVSALTNAVSQSSEVNLVIARADFKQIYESIITRFIKFHPIMLPFDSTLVSRDLVQIAQKVSWLLIFDITKKRLITPQMNLMKSRIYDSLARTFSELRRKLASMTASIADRFVELWSSAICASLFTMLMSQYEETELYRNYPFVVRIENDIRNLLVGFSSPYVQDYHHSIMVLIPKDLRLAFPKRLMVGGDDESDDLASAIKYEPEIARAWKRRKDTLFMASTQTALMQHAMKMTGARCPVEAKSQVVRRGNTEKSKLKVSKVDEIARQTKELFDGYDSRRQFVLDDIYDRELSYEKNGVDPENVPLGVTFDTFGKKEEDRPLYRVRPPGVEAPKERRVVRYSARAIAAAHRINSEGRSPRRVLKPLMTKTGRVQIRTYRHEKPFVAERVMREIDDAHNYLLKYH